MTGKAWQLECLTELGPWLQQPSARLLLSDFPEEARTNNCTAQRSMAEQSDNHTMVQPLEPMSLLVIYRSMCEGLLVAWVTQKAAA